MIAHFLPLYLKKQHDCTLITFLFLKNIIRLSNILYCRLKLLKFKKFTHGTVTYRLYVLPISLPH